MVSLHQSLNSPCMLSSVFLQFSSLSGHNRLKLSAKLHDKIDNVHVPRFLRASAMLKHVIDIGWSAGRLTVCPSVTRWYCIKTAEHIVMLSSPHDSPFILVLCVSRYPRNFDGVTPCGGAKYRWGIKICAIFYQ